MLFEQDSLRVLQLGSAVQILPPVIVYRSECQPKIVAPSRSGINANYRFGTFGFSSTAKLFAVP
jgi:hypothetical protein